MRALNVEIPGDLGALPGVAARIEEAGTEWGWPASIAYAVQLCLEEATSNSIRHGEAWRSGGLRVTLTQDDAAIVLEIADRGAAFNPLQAPPPPPPPPPPMDKLEDIMPGGHGIALMRKFCPGISYRRFDGANCLRLVFPVARN